MPEIEIVLILFCVAFLASAIDVIAGGGGLLTIPSLLLAGIPPLNALATNKAQAFFSPLYATYFFAKKKMFDWHSLKILIVFSSCGGVLGVVLVQFLDNAFLRNLIPFIFIPLLVYCLFAPKITQESKPPKIGKKAKSLFLSCIACYDGFFGAGTGTFLVLFFSSLLGMGASKAIAHAKLFNLISNFASLCVFAWSGWVMWKLALVMATGSILGSFVGSRVAYLFADVLIKPLVILISLAMCCQLFLAS